MGALGLVDPRTTTTQGRPWRGRRGVLDGILFILRTGAAWADLPERYPPYQTCHRRFQQWVRSGIMRGILEAVAEDLRLQEWLSQAWGRLSLPAFDRGPKK